MPDCFSFSNYTDVLDQLHDFGLMVDSLEIDTARPKRCRVTDDKSREKRGWCWLS